MHHAANEKQRDITFGFTNGAPKLRKKALNSWTAVQDTHFSIKLKYNYQVGHAEFKKLVDPGSSATTLMATAGTTLVIGFGLGWRGGKWYATRKFKRDQMLLGQIKP